MPTLRRQSRPDQLSVRRGRKEEFRSFGWREDPPDAQSPETFNQSRLSWGKRSSAHHAVMLNFYRRLISLRSSHPALSHPSKQRLEFNELGTSRVALMHRWHKDDHATAVFNFQKGEVTVSVPFSSGSWGKILDSAEEQWNGTGSAIPSSVAAPQEVRLGAYQMALFERMDN